MASWSQQIAASWGRVPRWLRLAVHSVACVIGAVVLPTLAYLLMTVIFSSIVVNADRAEVEEGVDVYINSIGIHTDLLIPKDHEAMYWYPWFPVRHFEKYIPNEYLRIGWGDRRVYTEVQYWSNLTARISVEAAFLKTPTLMHVSYWQRPELTNGITKVTLSPAEYRKLVAYIKAGFKLGANNRPILLTNVTHHGWDAFYEAHGSYDMVSTCNEWAGKGLREAGLPVGSWTPFSKHVAEHLQPSPLAELTPELSETNSRRERR